MTRGRALTRIAAMDLPAEPTPTTPLLVVRHAARALRAGELVRLTSDGLATDTRAAEAVMDEDPRAAASGLPRGSLLVLTGERMRSLGAFLGADQVHLLPLARSDLAPGRL